MLKWICLLLAMLICTAPAAAFAADGPLVIAHRGASGDRPEHTLAAYELAIDQGADYIEPDLVITSDLHLIARHDTELSATTDVAARDEFVDRRRSKTIDGQLANGWFAEDFTLAEIRTLRARERIPGIRPANARYDGLYQVPTFDEIVMLVRAKEAETGRRIGLYPELKHYTFLLREQLDGVDLLIAALRKHDLDSADAPVFVQSFEVAPLKRLDAMSDVKLVQLLEPEGGPADEPAMRYAEMVTPSGLAEIAQYADGIGVSIPMVLDESGAATGLVAAAQEAGLLVHVWTVRKENAFLPPFAKLSNLNATAGCVEYVFDALRKAGADGIFTDDPARTRTENLLCAVMAAP
ncbi:Glycerophosphodiester phosphodiesterase [Alteripontixanthobacter maritimus]|uniref:glycerophosphodiester phosphodiesterase n=1 Tax=Alteripontixanthobacter maritimus TaxID=2161824 RepID=A0A369QF32_9SPHN|nr:glycerophosphodiester phosphodiesterase family protein [Alteripontixanthobacter maritimus]RDC60908.1 Glycerophosphodiester phosphodiesterase [Alteripontixanthobacter maritimus]